MSKQTTLDRSFKVLFTTEEAEALKKEAESAGVSVSAMIRSIVQGRNPDHDHDQEQGRKHIEERPLTESRFKELTSGWFNVVDVVNQVEEQREEEKEDVETADTVPPLSIEEDEEDVQKAWERGEALRKASAGEREMQQKIKGTSDCDDVSNEPQHTVAREDWESRLDDLVAEPTPVVADDDVKRRILSTEPPRPMLVGESEFVGKAFESDWDITVDEWLAKSADAVASYRKIADVSEEDAIVFVKRYLKAGPVHELAVKLAALAARKEVK